MSNFEPKIWSIFEYNSFILLRIAENIRSILQLKETILGDNPKLIDKIPECLKKTKHKYIKKMVLQPLTNLKIIELH